MDTNSLGLTVLALALLTYAVSASILVILLLRSARSWARARRARRVIEGRLQAVREGRL